MKYEIAEPAENELREAVKYYNRKRKGLGNEFMKEVRHTISKILDFPEAWTLISLRARRCLMHRFPYGIIYQIREDKILIIAVMHLSRRPEYWKERIA